MTPSTRSKKLRSGLRTTSSTLLWPPQSPDRNSIENLWTDVKKAVHTCNSTSNEAAWIVVKESWERIPIIIYFFIYLFLYQH